MRAKYRRNSHRSPKDVKSRRLRELMSLICFEGVDVLEKEADFLTGLSHCQISGPQYLLMALALVKKAEFVLVPGRRGVWVVCNESTDVVLLLALTATQFVAPTPCNESHPEDNSS
jgi:hypothetical protein